MSTRRSAPSTRPSEIGMAPERNSDSERDVHKEDRLPAEVLDRDAAEQHARRGAAARDGAPGTERLVALGLVVAGTESLMIASVAGETIAPPRP